MFLLQSGGGTSLATPSAYCAQVVLFGTAVVYLVREGSQEWDLVLPLVAPCTAARLIYLEYAGKRKLNVRPKDWRGHGNSHPAVLKNFSNVCVSFKEVNMFLKVVMSFRLTRCS